ncbi:Protein phosphatase 1L [Linnemannia zychae]|nr:Protein phosphatase 1L [Linnemannia zychae]
MDSPLAATIPSELPSSCEKTEHIGNNNVDIDITHSQVVQSNHEHATTVQLATITTTVDITSTPPIQDNAHDKHAQEQEKEQLRQQDQQGKNGEEDIVHGTLTSVQPFSASHTPQESLPNDNATEASSSEKPVTRGRSSSLSQPLPQLTPDTPLPAVSSFNLLPQQQKLPLFIAIAKVLVVYGNVWQSAPELVDGIRLFGLVTLRGNTPKSTVQGAISTALSLAHSLKTFEPIEKKRAHGTTFYRMSSKVLDPSLNIQCDDTDIAEPYSVPPTAKKKTSSSRVRSNATKPKPRPKAQTSNNKRNHNHISDTSTKSKKRKPTSGSASDTLSSASSDDDDSMFSIETDRRPNSRTRQKSTTTDTKKGASKSTTARPAAPVRKDSIPNGLKKLPKGYVYDTEINQSALMNLSINPSQTGEYMQHLKGKNALENNFPDRRGEFGVDLTQEPATFALEQQTGYTYPRLRNSGRERLPKADCEDGYSITDLKHNGVFLGRLFCVTDGHGGRACSSFVIATIPGAMQVILGKYRPKDLSLPSVQELVKSQITEAVRLIDKEYLDYKKQQYLLYKDNKISEDPGSDGTTLIVNIFIDKWIICLNLGDSRTLLSCRDNIGRWNVEFHSEDHTPALERLAQTIYANGGEFVTHDDKVIRFDPNLKNDKKHRQSLKEARIRVKDGASNEYGIPYRTKNGQAASVNLGACIGDVLYKLDPVNPVLSCKPDITFIDISNIQQGFLLMASDGLWDYVQRGIRTQDQNWTVSQFVGDKIDRGWNHQRIVRTLSDRETSAGLYSESIQEYDDFTAILVTFTKQQLVQQQKRNQEHENLQILLQQQRLQEQGIQDQLVKDQEAKKQAEEAALAQKMLEVEMIRKEQEILRKAKAEANASGDETLSDSSQANVSTIFSRASVAVTITEKDTVVTTENEKAPATLKGSDSDMISFPSPTSSSKYQQRKKKKISPTDSTLGSKLPSSSPSGSTDSTEAEDRPLDARMQEDDPDVDMLSS